MAHDPKKLAYWADHYRNWQSSGLSQRSYCQRERLSFASFDHWRRRAREAADTTPSVVKQPNDSKLTLVPVRVGVAANTGDIQLRSPAGWCVSVPATLGLDAVAQLLSRLP